MKNVPILDICKQAVFIGLSLAMTRTSCMNAEETVVLPSYFELLSETFQRNRPPKQCVSATLNGKKIIIIGSLFGTLSVPDAENDTLLSIFKGHESAITTLAIDSKFKVLLSGSEDKTVRLWSLSAIHEGFNFLIIRHPFPIIAVAFSMCGKKFMTVQSNYVYDLWNLEEVKYPKGKLVTDIQTIFAVKFHGGFKSEWPLLLGTPWAQILTNVPTNPSGTLTLNKINDQTAAVRGILQEKAFHVLKVIVDDVYAIEDSPKGNLFITVSANKETGHSELCLWQSLGGILLLKKQFNRFLYRVAFGSDEITLMTIIDQKENNYHTYMVWNIVEKRDKTYDLIPLALFAF